MQEAKACKEAADSAAEKLADSESQTADLRQEVSPTCTLPPYLPARDQSKGMRGHGAT